MHMKTFLGLSQITHKGQTMCYTSTQLFPGD